MELSTWRRQSQKLTSLLRQAWQWWAEGLADCVPGLSARFGSLHDAQFEARIKDDAIEIALYRRGALELITRLSLGSDTGPESRKHTPATTQSVALHVPDDRVLTRTLSFPLAAEQELHSAIGFEIDRQTPFAKDAVVFDHVVVERDAAARRVRVQLHVIPKQPLAGAVAALEAAGYEITHLLHSTPTGERAVRLDRPALAPGFNVSGALGALATLALLIAVIVTPLVLQEREIARLDERLDTLKPKALEKANEERSARDAAAFVQRVQVLHSARMPATEVIDLLVQRLPETTWVVDLSLQEEQLIVVGNTTRESDAAHVFDGETRVRDLSYQTMVDPSSADRRFQIVAKVGGR